MTRLLFCFLLAASCFATDLAQVRALIDAGDRAAARKLATVWLDAASAGKERGDALNSLAETWATGRAADTARVRELTTEALSLAPGQVESLVILAEQLSQAGDNKQAREVLEQAVARDKSSYAAQLPLARVRMLLGDLDAARSLYQTAIASMETRYGPSSMEVASALTSLGGVLNTATLYAEARTQLERAVAIQEAGHGTGLGESLTALAYTLYCTGEYSKARNLAERAGALFEQDPLRNLAAAGQSHRVLGDILTSLGDRTGADLELERAERIDEKLFGSGSVEAADDKIGIGNAAEAAGDSTAARKWFLEALATYEERLDPENTRVGGALDDLGQALIRLHEYPEAKRCFERALAIQTKALGPESPWTANVYQGLAKVAAATGDYAVARQMLERNLETWTAQLGPSHAFTLTSLTLLADVLAHAGDRAAAMKTALEAARRRREYVEETVRTLSERQALQIAGRNTNVLDTALAVAGDSTADTKAAWDELIRSRALVLDEMAARNRAVRASNDPAMPALLGEAGRARSELAHAAAGGKDTGLSEKRVAVRRAEEALAARSDLWQGRLRRHAAGLAEVSSALPPDAALVAYVRFHRPGEKEPAPAYEAFVLRGGVARVVSLGNAARIESQTAALGREIARERDAGGHGEQHNEALYRTAGEALRRTVWDPVEPSIAGAKQIYIVPDGALQLVNFAALPAGTEKYLIENPAVLHMLSAERDMIQSPRPAIQENKLLALGNPAFGSKVAAMRGLADSCVLKFDALPGTGRETADVAALWQSLGNPAETLTGARASESLLQQSVAGKRVVHIATHGFFLDSRCGNSPALSDNPLLRSGLALSDGVLSAEQAAGLNLDDAEWVVLSGCDTGLGDVRAGEGVLGLRRAFQEAGARTVVASLWPVEDDATRAWMASLYRYRFAIGLPAAQALRAADRDLLGHRRGAHLSTHPYYWASFIAVERE